MTRDEMIASLVLHGWYPVKTKWSIGILNRDREYGYAMYAGHLTKIWVGGDAEWDELDSKTLQLLCSHVIWQTA